MITNSTAGVDPDTTKSAETKETNNPAGGGVSRVNKTTETTITNSTAEKDPVLAVAVYLKCFKGKNHPVDTMDHGTEK
ncbi:agglutinin-like protein 2 isoform X1 [Tachysurus ichikawai]